MEKEIWNTNEFKVDVLELLEILYKATPIGGNSIFNNSSKSYDIDEIKSIFLKAKEHANSKGITKEFQLDNDFIKPEKETILNYRKSIKTIVKNVLKGVSQSKPEYLITACGYICDCCKHNGDDEDMDISLNCLRCEGFGLFD